MTLEKTIIAAIKAHNADNASPTPILDYCQYNKGLRLISMGPDNRRGAQIDSGDGYGLRLTVKCKFKPVNKYDDSVVLYEVILYSTGEIDVYFDGTCAA